MNQTLLNRIILVLSCIGLYIAGTLSLGKLLNRSVPCGLSGGCDVVQNHPSSMWFGIPVAYYGFAGYLAILAFVVLRMIATKNGDVAAFNKFAKFGFYTSIVGAIASIILQVISFTFIGALCLWCLGSAAVMIILAIMHAILFQNLVAPNEHDGPTRKPDFALLTLLVAGTVVGLGLGVSALGKGPKPTTIKTDVFGSQTPMQALVDGGNSKGPVEAKVTIVEFADLFCPSCRISFNKMEKLLAQHPGKLRWVFRHFPLYMKPDHEMSLPAAMLSEYAARKGKFWEFVGTVFESGEGQNKEESQLLDIVENLGLDRTEAKEIIDAADGPEFERVYSDLDLANKLGIEFTPSFIVFAEGVEPIVVLDSALNDKLKEEPYATLLK